jgi:NADPH-dependent 2,4-dienoyl-CoA reductase/sulfur reductase-like enzyme
MSTMTIATPTIPVVNIGAGPLGFSASMALSRLGIPDMVIEKHPP